MMKEMVHEVLDQTLEWALLHRRELRVLYEGVTTIVETRQAATSDVTSGLEGPAQSDVEEIVQEQQLGLEEDPEEEEEEKSNEGWTPVETEQGFDIEEELNRLLLANYGDTGPATSYCQEVGNLTPLGARKRVHDALKKLDLEPNGSVEQVTNSLLEIGNAVNHNNGHEREKSLDELLAAIRTLSNRTLFKVALHLQKVAPVKRMRELAPLVSEAENSKAKLIHSAATLALGKAWDLSINERCWPVGEWVRPEMIEDTILHLTKDRLYFNPRSYESRVTRFLRLKYPGSSLRPNSYNDAVANLYRMTKRRKARIVAVIKQGGSVEGGYYCLPQRHSKARSELKARRTVFVSYKELPHTIQRDAATAMDNLEKEILSPKDFVPVAKKIREGIEEGFVESKTKLNRQEVRWREVLADCIIDGVRVGAIKLPDPPEKWHPTEKARYHDIIFEALEKANV